MKLWKRVVIHPFLMAVYPLLVLLGANMGNVAVLSAARSLVLSLLFAGALFGMCRAILRDTHRAGLLTTLILLLFYSYGHVYGLVRDIQVYGLALGRHRFLFPACLVIFFLGGWAILRSKKDLGGLNAGLNVLLLWLICFPLWQVLTFEQRTSAMATAAEGSAVEKAPVYSQLSSLRVAPGQQPPDIYYIILDAYTRDDTLLNFLGYDNQPFLNRLGEMGFTVARCSQSNYSNTLLSLASSLNLSYLDDFGVDIRKNDSQPALKQLVFSNLARRALENLGYKVVSIESGFSITEWRDADYFLSAGGDIGASVHLWSGVNRFEGLILRTSAGVLIYKAWPVIPAGVRSALEAAYIEHRNYILYSLEKLEDISDLPGPKFVFVHIIAPHEPFVFGPNGEYVERKIPFTLNNDLETRDVKTYQRGYRDQLIYLNGRVEAAVKSILANSKTPPVIVLQGDHGILARVTSQNSRLTILNAYYLPGEAGERLYDTITPVNTFRLIFDAYFGGRLGLLEDRSYYYDNQRNDYMLSPNTRQGCGLNLNP